MIMRRVSDLALAALVLGVPWQLNAFSRAAR